MKKFLSSVLVVLMLVTTLCITTFAEETPLSAEVYVTISDKDGKLALVQEKITVTDIDGDNALTVNDALYCAHEAKYEGGAEAGYGSAVGEWGLSLTKLWGEENGGSYGYYLNNVLAMGLTDAVKSGDYINAFVYTDLTTWSDTYCYFDEYTKTADRGAEITLTLSSAGYDADYNPITVPVADATILVNGVATEYKTDTEGNVTVKIDNPGKNVISAQSDTQTLVPPVCVATVSSDAIANVYVTISDKDGKLALTQEKISVSDADKDGALTINDALYCAHEAKYEGGASAGYASYYGAYGLSLSKLWGEENGGSYGYYVNNVSAWNLADTVKEGDYVNAFVYTDLTAWSDTYCYFDTYTKTADKGAEITLTLSSAGYDADYNPITVPVANANITVNGETTDYKTDAEGKVTIKIDVAGDVIISAVSSEQTLVPPTCRISVSENTENNGTTNQNGANEKEPDDNINTLVWVVIIVAVVIVAGVAVFVVTKKKSNEK